MKKRGSSKCILCFARHLLPRLSHPTPRMRVLLAGLLFALAPGGTPSSAAGEPQRDKGSHQDDFVVFGTVFTEKGFALPGAEVRVRRAGGRKTRWEARSDRRGEFAVRVPRGAEYEMTVTAAGYQEQARKINARTGNREDLVFRLPPASGGKPK